MLGKLWLKRIAPNVMQDTQIKVAIYKHFAETGRAPSASMVARLTGSDTESVRQGYARLRAQRVLVLQSDGEWRVSSARNRWDFEFPLSEHSHNVRYLAPDRTDVRGIICGHFYCAAVRKQFKMANGFLLIETQSCLSRSCSRN